MVCCMLTHVLTVDDMLDVAVGQDDGVAGSDGVHEPGLSSRLLLAGGAAIAAPAAEVIRGAIALESSVLVSQLLTSCLEHRVL